MSSELRQCLLLLQEAELLLLKNGESLLAAQLSIVTGRLLLRYPQEDRPVH